MIEVVLAFAGGIAVGLLLAFFLKILQGRNARELAAELYRENESQRQANVDAMIENVKSSFGNLSLEALSRSTGEFLKLAQSKLEAERETSGKELDSKKSLIDQQLQTMTLQIDKVAKTMAELEKDRVEKFGQLDSSLKMHSEQTQALMQTTNALRQALSSTKARGQWGERMAEDVLRLAGFIENVNYQKQKTLATGGSRPDFTFLLPHELKLNMDVKFPLDNYLKYLEADSDSDRNRHRLDFLRDVRARVKEVTTRDYIDPEERTVDYCLLFIPNEQVYAFIHEQDSAILDDALKTKVIFCSPLTLFAILAVIRQAVDNFALEKTSHQILSLYGEFRKQWEMFGKRFEALGKKIVGVQEDYDEITGVRRQKLDKVLGKIEDLRTQTGIPLLPDEPDATNGR